MAVLPAGFGLPPPAYLLGLLAALAGVGYGVVDADPAFRERHVLALVPWMCAGAAGHVLYVLGALPSVVLPLFGTPAAYLTTAAVAGAVWLLALRVDATPRGDADAWALGLVGLFALVPTVGGALAYGAARGSLDPGLPALGLAVGALLGGGVATALFRLRPDVAVSGRAGALALVAHGVDGVTTAVGVDLLGYGERTPLSRFVIEVARGLPTAEVLGAGWLFVLVKLAVATVVVLAVAPTVREAPREGNALLAGVAAVGLGPGVHNALLFAVAGG